MVQTNAQVKRLVRFAEAGHEIPVAARPKLSIATVNGRRQMVVVKPIHKPLMSAGR